MIIFSKSFFTKKILLPNRWAILSFSIVCCAASNPSSLFPLDEIKYISALDLILSKIQTEEEEKKIDELEKKYKNLQTACFKIVLSEEKLTE